jgi:pilus assembly protein CpaE
VTAVCDHDPSVAQSLRTAAGDAVVLESLEALRQHLENTPAEHTVVLGPSIEQRSALQLAAELRVERPQLGVVLVRRAIDTSVLALALRAGIREVVHLADLPGLGAAISRSQALSDALRDRIAADVAEHEGTVPGKRGRIVTVFSAKGGCGKTTLATNVAAALAENGRRKVCLVDLDLAFGDVAIALQLFPSHTIADAVPAGTTIDLDALRVLLTPHSPGLTTLVAPLEPGSADSISADLVTRILQVLRTDFDFVVVDTPPAFDDRVLAAFDLSDHVGLIATLDIPAIKNLKLTLETLDLLNFPRENWRVVLNRADSKVGLTIGEVESTLRCRILTQIPSSRDVPASVNRGVPIVLDEPKHAVSVAIRSFVDKHIINVTPVAHAPARGDGDRRTARRWRARN